MSKQKWIFWDIGSTLVNEQAAYDHRAREMLKDTGITFEEFDKLRLNLAWAGLEGNSAAISRLKLQKTPWPQDKELLYPAANSVLAELSERGFRMGIIANQTSGLEARLKNWGLLPYFEVIASSAEAGKSKPDPAIFSLVMDQAGCKPEEAIMVGDRLVHDIHPATHLGMQSIWVRQGMAAFIPMEYGKEATWIVNSIEEIPNVLKETE